MKRSRRYEEAIKNTDRSRTYVLDEAVKLLKDLANSKFDETVELAVRLGVDPKRSDQMVRSTTVLPHGTGKTLRVLVLTKGQEAEAKAAGADMVGSQDYLEKIKNGWLDFDACIATPDVMGEVAKLGKILGPKGLMPNPKVGTVTQDVAKAVREIKKGRVEFRSDKTGNVHLPVGKVSFKAEQLLDNMMEFWRDLWKAKPPTAKGHYIRSAYLTSTMGPSFKLDLQDIALRLK
ncbi:50S ribosomal protein L1 [candidate division TA06 bacterium DG_26]|uniref:Large ribosomal subunit protein uL1 n=1 Tax=candidate division TA06 bacterium DG_26 TaxID=1703771 RepID=A0A0S7WMD6_UNCT6|nr:MAG: 50S ribosomal protein L1 [candidate division TA06 bacterium DG_26]